MRFFLLVFCTNPLILVLTDTVKSNFAEDKIFIELFTIENNSLGYLTLRSPFKGPEISKLFDHKYVATK